MANNPVTSMSVFALGFRAFFLVAGLSAPVLILVWQRLYTGQMYFGGYYGSVGWHAHEMIFGYTVAVVAGFLLTAVRNWTGIETAKGTRLGALTLLWAYGRIVPFYAGIVPGWLIALVDLAFLPWLTAEVGGAIVQGKHYKSLLIVALLLVMTLGNLLCHLDVLGFIEGGAPFGTRVAIAAVVLLMLVIAGRVVPFFTERGIQGAAPKRRPILDKCSIGIAAGFFVVDLSAVAPSITGLLGVATAALNGYRMFGWYDAAIWRVPLLWVLFVGYGWIVVGFVLAAGTAYAPLPNNLSLHAFTVGGIGVLTLGMMARVSLGHTGRPLRCARVVEAAFVLINVSAFVRSVVPLAFPAGYTFAVSASAVCWSVAFALFAYEYVPILISPRVDGRPG